MNNTIIDKLNSIITNNKLTHAYLFEVNNYDDDFKVILNFVKMILSNMTYDEVINTDLKIFTSGDIKFAVAQVFTLDIDEINKDIDNYLKALEENNTKLGCKFTMLAFTDVIKNGSYVIYTEEAKNILAAGYKKVDFKQMTYIDGLASRKKQMVPVILSELE